jgi:hypothetical protein
MCLMRIAHAAQVYAIQSTLIASFETWNTAPMPTAAHVCAR